MTRKQRWIGTGAGFAALLAGTMLLAQHGSSDAVRVTAIEYTGANVCTITASGRDAYGKTEVRATNNTGFSPDCPRVGDTLYRCDYSNELSPQKSECMGSKMAVYAIIGERERP